LFYIRSTNYSIIIRDLKSVSFLSGVIEFSLLFSLLPRPILSTFLIVFLILFKQSLYFGINLAIIFWSNGNLLIFIPSLIIIVIKSLTYSRDNFPFSLNCFSIAFNIGANWFGVNLPTGLVFNELVFLGDSSFELEIEDVFWFFNMIVIHL
jgi:hypothetical protein